MPLFAPGATFHSNSNSKFLYFSLLMMSTRSDSSQPAIVLSEPSSTRQHLLGKVSRLKPRQAAVDLPSNKTCHCGLAAPAVHRNRHAPRIKKVVLLVIDMISPRGYRQREEIV